MQRELLNRQHWTCRVVLASVIFEWIEGWCNPRRRHRDSTPSTRDLNTRTQWQDLPLTMQRPETPVAVRR
jgi:hypothetical protein